MTLFNKDVHSGGSGGTTDYNKLINKPEINNVEVKGNKKGSDLGLVDVQQGVENAGKILKVSPEGNLNLSDAQEAMSGMSYSGTDELFDVIEFDNVDYNTAIKNIPTLNGVSLKGALTSNDIRVVGSAQGVEHAGKFLGIDENGNVTPKAAEPGSIDITYDSVAEEIVVTKG